MEKSRGRYIEPLLLVFAAFFVLKYVFSAFLLVALAAAVSYGVSFIADSLAHGRRGLAVLFKILILLGLLSLSGVGIFLACSRLLSELRELCEYVSDDREEIEGVIGAWLTRAGAALNSFGIDGVGLLNKGLDGGISFALSKAGELLSRAVGSTPYLLMWLFTFVMSCFYLTLDRERILKMLSGLCVGERGRAFFSAVTAALLRYLRVYGLMLAVTFLEVLVIFALIKEPYALLWAVVVALVDALPVLGAGAVLLPMSGWYFLVGNPRHGLALLVTYGIVTLVRQIVEPRLVGDSLGLHPFFTLVFMLVGFSVLGIKGMIFAPIIAVIVMEMMRGGVAS